MSHFTLFRVEFPSPNLYGRLDGHYTEEERRDLIDLLVLRAEEFIRNNVTEERIELQSSEEPKE